MDTREELIQALDEGRRPEHGLMIQYLFAAFTMKKRLDEGITGSQQEIIRKWEGQILTVAGEEMAHLGTVCNLVSAIGGSPHFGRPNFPQVAEKDHPFMLHFSLFFRRITLSLLFVLSYLKVKNYPNHHILEIHC